ncbi:MAG: hypothetical protein QOD42_383 [Sphingomonadales bacterium]|jgi:hypothetical protein|nr:hypothetical protein [Sphingomonadales bacterium]
MIFTQGFAEQNWLITPAATAPIAPQQVATTGSPPPPPPAVHTTGSLAEADRVAQAALREQKWLLVLSGVALVNFEGTLANDWNHETLDLGLASALAPPLDHIIGAHRIARPSRQHVASFQVEQAAPFAGLSAIFGNGSPRQPGYAVDDWGVNLFTGTEAGTNASLRGLFAGLLVALAVRNRSAIIYRVSYTVSLLGRIRFAAPPPIL